MSGSRWVAGVDGCRAGWVVVYGLIRETRRQDASAAGECVFETVRCARVESVREVVESRYRPSVVAVDMPIGLPEKAARGGRACDRAARERLGKGKASSVFSAPVRSVLACDDYTAALRASRKSSVWRLGLSKQTWNLVPKIREVDEVVREAMGGRFGEVGIVEAHPEVSFGAMFGRAIGTSKKTADGQRDRMIELKREGVAVTPEALALVKHGQCEADDVIDAHACAWTARRVALGVADVLPPEGGETDAHGIDMRLWV
ncbi:MAG: DUF429 domain-containing protein [Planctomycetota bacterium]